MFNCDIKDKLDNIEKKFDTLANKDDVETLKKDFEDFRDIYLMSTNQNYLKKKIKEYIIKNYKNIPLKYVKDETSWIKERWTYENDEITIVKKIMKSDMFSCNKLDCNFHPISFFSTYNYYVKYKDIELINGCDTKEIFDKLEELKKTA